MNEKLNLLGKQHQDIIAIPEWFMLYMIKARVLEPASGPGEKGQWIVLLEGDSLTMSFAFFPWASWDNSPSLSCRKDEDEKKLWG